MKPSPPEKIPVVILAGGNQVEFQGVIMPKACVIVAGKSMIAHTLNHYQRFGHQQFVVCSGSGHEKICEEVVRFKKGSKKSGSLPIEVRIKHTGEKSGTARRIREVFEDISKIETVAVTYVDIISDVDLNEIRRTHIEEKSITTLTAVHLPTRFKALGVALFSPKVQGFATKPITENTLVSGGFYFLNPRRLLSEVSSWKYHESFENDTLPCLAMQQEVAYQKHEGFWQSVDSPRDIRTCEEFLSCRIAK